MIDFKRGFKNHFQAYKYLENKVSDASKDLILCYCVECGLKYLYLQKLKIHEFEKLSDDQKGKIKTHNIESLIKLAQVSGSYEFGHFKTTHGQTVTSGDYHELCRYCIPVKYEAENPKVKKFKTSLIKLALWLSERVV